MMFTGFKVLGIVVSLLPLAVIGSMLWKEVATQRTRVTHNPR